MLKLVGGSKGVSRFTRAPFFVQVMGVAYISWNFEESLFSLTYHVIFQQTRDYTSRDVIQLKPNPSNPSLPPSSPHPETQVSRKLIRSMHVTATPTRYSMLSVGLHLVLGMADMLLSLHLTSLFMRRVLHVLLEEPVALLCLWAQSAAGFGSRSGGGVYDACV